MNKSTHRWSSTTKTIVILILLAGCALIVYRFQDIIPPLAIALLVSFILVPVVNFFTNRLHIPRGLAAALLLLLLILGIVATPIAAVPSLQEAVISVEVEITSIIDEISAFLIDQPPVEILGYTIRLDDFYDQLSTLLNSFVTVVAGETINIALNVASGVLWSVFVLTITFYLLKDSPRMIEQLDQFAPPSYRDDFVRLRKQITDVWHAFLRGQLLLSIIIAVITTAVCWIVGLPYPGALGLLAGLLEVIPNVGPTLAAIPAVLLALFEGTDLLPLSNFWFAVLVTGLYVLIQQVENNLLVPRIMGSSLNLHPVLVLIGVVVGGSLGGVLGMLLAAPVLATLRVLGHYVRCRIFDLDPFAEQDTQTASKPGPFRQLYQKTRRWLQVKMGRGNIHIRTGKSADRAAVEAICDGVWGELEDYVPEVWEEWAADPVGELAVVEVDGQVAGFGKLSRLEDDEWWLEGFRVDPDRQGQGIGGQLQAHLIEKALQVGHGTLRYGTHSLNKPIHRLSDRHGFRRAAVYRLYKAGVLPASDGPMPRRLTKTDLAAAWALIEQSPRYEAAKGLYEVAWQWKRLTREQLAHHLEDDEAWGINVNGALAALALPHWTREDETLHLGYIDGLDEALPAILQGLRRLAAHLGYKAVRIKPVEEDALVAAIETAGYERRWNRDIWVFERTLDEEVGE